MINDIQSMAADAQPIMFHTAEFIAHNDSTFLYLSSGI